MLYFHQPELYPWIVLVHELVCYNPRTPVVVLDCLCGLQAVQHYLQGIVQVVRHTGEVYADVQLKEAFNV